MFAAQSSVNVDEILAGVPRIDGIVPLYVDGGWRLAADGVTRDDFNPANGRKIATVAEAGIADVEAAINAARRAFDDGPWREVTAADRAALLFKVADANRCTSRRVHAHQTRSQQ